MTRNLALAAAFSVALLLMGCGEMDNDDDDNVGPAGVQAPSQSGDSDPTPNDAGTLNNQRDPGAPGNTGTGTGASGTQNGANNPGGQTPNGQIPTPKQSPDVQPADQQ